MSRGVVTFVFDDGYEKVYQNVLPILRKFSLPGVFAIPLDASSLEKNEYRKTRHWKAWLSIEQEGHEIASHSVDHPDLTRLPSQKRKEQLQKPSEVLQATTFVYPHGKFNEDVIRETSRYYTAARTVQKGFETIPPQNPLQLRSYNFSRDNFSVRRANFLALQAFLKNTWLIETYHMIHNEHHEEMPHNVRTDDFEKHAQFLSLLPIAVKTIREVVSGI